MRDDVFAEIKSVSNAEVYYSQARRVSVLEESRFVTSLN